MKVRVNNILYVQWKDICFASKVNLLSSNYRDIKIPSELRQIMYDFSGCGRDEYSEEFIGFSNPEIIKYFEALDFICDFNYFADMSDEQLSKLIEFRNEVINSENEIWDKQEYTKESITSMFPDHFENEYKTIDLETIRDFKSANNKTYKIKFVTPNK